MNKYIVEFIGTFFLVLTIFAAVAKAGAMAPLAIGAALMVMVYAGGHISGAHYNPAVSLAAWMRGALGMGDLIPYMVAQIAGAAIAAVLGMSVFGWGGAGDGTVAFLPGLLAELLGTFALVWVVLNTATAKGTEGNSFYGLAIGLTVTAMAYGLGAVGTGGAFNPAVAIGASIGGLMNWANILIYALGCFGGAALAAVVFRMVSPSDHE